MWREFANPAALWAVAGIPALIAIHFFQQQNRIERSSTVFLIEAIAPVSPRGRKWHRFRASRIFWLQLAALLLAIWVLAQPRWARVDSSQNVVLVLDDSAAMSAFRPQTAAAVDRLIGEIDGHAARTSWLVISTGSPVTPLYRGLEARQARGALERWQPAMGTHDLAPALRLARRLVGPTGISWLITSTRANVPPGQAAIGVGHPLANTGFAGATVANEGSQATWHAIVKNYASTSQHRTWWLEAAGHRTTAHGLDLPPDGMIELGGVIPDGVERCVVALEGDEFVADDRLALVRPHAKPLTVHVDFSGAAGEFIAKVLGSLDGITSVEGSPKLRVTRQPSDQPLPANAAIVLPEKAALVHQGSVAVAPVVAERNPLVSDLNWQGLLDEGPASLVRHAGDPILLWQGESPLVWLSGNIAATRKLVLDFEWDESNASRLPAVALLLRRYAEQVQEAQPTRWTGNFDCGAPISISTSQPPAIGPLTTDFEPVDGSRGTKTPVPPQDHGTLRAPAQPGFFSFHQGTETLVEGAAHFADPRQADFRRAETFRLDPAGEAGAELARTMRPDPLEKFWLLAAGVCLLLSWWSARPVTVSLRPRMPESR